jgi:hypothetical protein
MKMAQKASKKIQKFMGYRQGRRAMQGDEEI